MNSHNLVEIAEHLEKECGFKYLKSSSNYIPHIVYKKKIGEDIHFVSLRNKSDDPKIKDWTILSELQSGRTCHPYELSFKENELFREFILALKYNFE
jgi:hypothetical protein